MKPVETFDPLDRQIGALVARWGNEWAAHAAMLASRNVRLGHSCLDLRMPAVSGNGEEFRDWPSLEEWKELLRAHVCVGAPGETKPLILDGPRLYLSRYHAYEVSCASRLLSLARGTTAAAQLPLFQEDVAAQEGQKAAIECGLKNKLTIISGGPGTGKTFTAIKILERLLKQNPKARISLAAPTGKAADRLQKAAARHDGIRVQTVHRMLGLREDGRPPRHDEAHPLPLDVLFVDEVSMLDLATAAKLLAALPADARLVLLGDHQQLASVEAGAILGDIATAAGNAASAVHPCFIRLTDNFRFNEKSGIATLSELIRRGDAGAVVDALTKGTLQGITWSSPRSAGAPEIEEMIREGFRSLHEAPDAGTALRAVDDFRVLCAVRRGPWGAESINGSIQSWLARGPRPVMVTRNDYGLSLFNGDTGVVVEEENGTARAWFAGSPEPRALPLAGLPTHESAHAITIHKSQGSEFRRVLCVLPEADSPILSRELLYTAVSRAREEVHLVANETALRAAITQPTRRHSGLSERLGG